HARDRRLGSKGSWRRLQAGTAKYHNFFRDPAAKHKHPMSYCDQLQQSGKERAKTASGGAMALKESHVVGPAAPAVRDITLGQLLEQAVRSATGRLALIAGLPAPPAPPQ